ncbi:nose resistant to fluoxetine protein 6-like isoform X2 [Rhynchophorus ferrugineus]|uniref:nose resistant to fluoxetine protein 6-like isoform X2 n=1 Tax=Rhynchophorus ferrugineus TaxID=354439 RepID=UPI003FCE9779
MKGNGFSLVLILATVGCSEEVFRHDFNLFPELPVGVSDSNNELCWDDNSRFIEGLKNFTLWAHEMWDATAKSSTGVLRGSSFQMGHFEQCLTAKAPFATQYCLATVRMHVPALYKVDRDHLSIDFDGKDSVLDRLYRYNDVTKQPRDTVNFGWCVPASCSVHDLKTALSNYLNSIDVPLETRNVSYTGQVTSSFCHQSNDKQTYNIADYSFCLVTLILVLLVFISTAYDYQTESPKSEEKAKKKSLAQKMFLAFSARLNFLEMAHLETTNKDLNILYGLRTIAIMIVILDHRFGTFTSSALLNFDYVEVQYRAIMACLVFHGDLFVDSFFILSGLLVTYGLLSQFDKRMVNPGFIVFLRYIRLTPVYAFVIFYYATMFDYTGNGPLWKIIAGADSNDCKKNWWLNLLYLNNYINADHMCMTHAWYLPCDFHYFIIAIGICILIKKEKKIGLSALFSVIIISMVIPFILTVAYSRPAMLLFYPDFLTGPKTHPDFLLTYSKSHTRATPYFMGMVAGYIYYKLKGKNNHVCRFKTTLIVLASLLSIVASIFCGAIFYNPYHEYNTYESAAYAALHRPLWAMGSIGLMYVASYGHASFLSKILTWNPWIPLSKLQYGAYLVHMQFQLRAAAKFMSPRYISFFDLISLSLSDIVLAFITALCLYLMIEAPLRKIFKELLNPKREPKKPKTDVEEAAATENPEGTAHYDNPAFVSPNNSDDSRL